MQNNDIHKQQLSTLHIDLKSSLFASRFSGETQ